MSQRAVEQALGKLLTDEEFRERFFQNPGCISFLAGLDLTGDELAALRRLPQDELAKLGRCLDDRICRLRVLAHPDPKEASR